jgi:soluble lytic murein transglycosylase-like protein
MAPTDKQALMVLAKTVATRFKLAPELVCAVVEQESGWNPWAMRYEPMFFAKYVAHLYTNNQITASEAYARGFSWGLMQVMGQVAREMGYTPLFLSGLCDPEAGLSIGCELLWRKLDAAKGDVTAALLAWNGGGNKDYPKQVLARVEKYTK